jgi:NDP-sugar pyrophosphorylase family protein
MKVVLFCGGYGMRMRDGVSDLPKPMTTVGPRPLIWHVMRYYAHFGHTDFVLCLGYGAHHIKDYFLHYDETASNDFVLRGGDVELLGSDIRDWTITFVHTGLTSPIGERLRRVRKGYFVLRPEIFDYIPENGDLVSDGAMVLAKEGRMMAYPYRGFWQPADTVKERTALEAAYQGGTRPWMLWDPERAERTPLQATIAALRNNQHER